MDDIISALRRRCMDFPGAVDQTSPYIDEFKYGILDTIDNTFASIVPNGKPPTLRLKCRDADGTRLANLSRSVRVTKWKGWTSPNPVTVEIALDGSVPWNELEMATANAYRFRCETLAERWRIRLVCITRNLNGDALIEELLSSHRLQSHQAAIRKLQRPAMYLKTRMDDAASSALGATRVGGRPDLPRGVDWPRFAEGKPLAFLGQVNLAEVAKAAPSFGLPKHGLLSFFSVLGWQENGASDPVMPPGRFQYAWNRFLRFDVDPTTLERKSVPQGVTSFKAAAVELVPFDRFPATAREISTTQYGWDDDTLGTYLDFARAYDEVNAHRHRIFRPTLLCGSRPDASPSKRQLLFQLGSDDHAEMGWGDGGALYFWIDPADLAMGDFDRVHSDYDCG